MKINSKSINYNVSTVEDLATIVSPSTGDTVVVTDENRGGVFVCRDTGTANGGTIFAGNSGKFWHRQYDGAVNVKWFGAVGDGITDDTVAIQNAIDSLCEEIALNNNDVYNISSTDLIISNPITFSLRNSNLQLNSNSIKIQSSGVSILGLSRQDENNSKSRIIYSGNSNAIIVKAATTATALYACKFENFEVSAVGGAVSSTTAKAFAFYGTRDLQCNNIEVYNFTQGTAMYFTGNGSVVNGFGATSHINYPAFSAVKYGIISDTNGGSASTFGIVHGGFIFGSTNAILLSCESWRIYSTDLGGTPSVKIDYGADDTILVGCRWEASSQEILIAGGVLRTQIIAPSFINHQGALLPIIDNSTHATYITPTGIIGSKLNNTTVDSINTFSGATTDVPANGGTINIHDFTTNGGMYLVSVMQADGGLLWRASYLVTCNGLSITTTPLLTSYTELTASGTMLQIKNTNTEYSMSFIWSILRLL